MCHYCGCRQMMLIRDYVSEHESALAHGDRLLRACAADDLDAARVQLVAMAEVLRSHWQGEENGIFAVMSREPEYADYIAPLVDEHRELEILLATADVADPRDQQRLATAIEELQVHISKEEDGLFPASLVMLTGDEWDAASGAWRAAHPGQELQT